MKRPAAIGAFALCYDQASGKPAFSRLSKLLRRVLASHPGGARTLLDVGCGTGLALELFDGLGYTCVGVDASLPMLRVAAARERRIVGGDFRALPLRGRFGVVTILNDTLTSLRSWSDLLRCFRSIRGCMGPQSLLLFDTSQPRALARWSRRETYRLRGRGYDVSISTSYSRGRRVGTLRFRGHAGADLIEEVHEQRSYSRAEITRALRRASLREVEVIDFRRFPPPAERTPQYEAWLFVARPV
ncbi:MAG TPA: class I SAM-dependent methyltransferase [Thermoanaerobaculia bacterium]|nr:class I SAM-dependent methyltransferase [Thermoanaerobaculia bacterium]